MTNKLVTNLQKFKLITFDVTDTLLKFKKHPGLEYRDVALKFGYKNLEADKIIAHFSSNFKQMTSDYPNFGRDKINWEKWWRLLIFNIYKSAGTTISEKDSFLITEELIEKYETAECWVIEDKAVELIEKIKDSEKYVGIISNFDPRLKFLVANLKLPNFNFVLSSYEVGAAKPDPRIFDLALQLTNFDAMPEDALHIGNTPTLDYIAAKESGWTSALITNGDDDWLMHKEEINKNRVFQSLGDFLTKLESEDIDWGDEAVARDP